MRKRVILTGAVLVGAFTLVTIGTFWPKDKEVVPVVIETVIAPIKTKEILGKSVQGRDMEVYSYGNGSTSLVFIGGVHGGYEWNSVALAYQFIDYLDSNPEYIPNTLRIYVIPSANPDGVFKVTGKEGRVTPTDVTKDKEILAQGRFNANNVDLNRNFDCKWQPKSTWRSKTVSAGSAPFSEPEAKALQTFIQKIKPSATVFWHSQSNGVYASQCKNGILPETIKIMNAYSEASGYPAVDVFDAYEVTGAIDDWMASISIPAITVELKTHEEIEWSRNIAGVDALVKLFK